MNLPHFGTEILRLSELLVGHDIPLRRRGKIGGGTLAIFPIEDGQFHTLVVDGLEGIYLTGFHTRTLMQQLMRTYYHLTIQTRVERQYLETQLGLGHQRPVIVLNNEYYIPLSSAKNRDTTWISGHWLRQIDFTGPKQILATFNINQQTITVEAHTSMGRKQMSEFVWFATTLHNVHFAAIKPGLLRYLTTQQATPENNKAKPVPAVIYKGVELAVNDIDATEHGRNLFGLADLLNDELTVSLI
ncbi:competence protein ComK [Lacticaseibacillus brantae]|uniref:Uncharacterized protein n=1 Tax=Lacticaseibacillus brantae DSM 23927 TaxID=1423727 RepID=A0A0R2AW11_9LACO|nr:competence protein ComK [Lacticaseibacillus brantae]KRM71159.1 hypothetical protein FC34_GL001850 [Lacticaseibacillus brantae DSM 23927]